MTKIEPMLHLNNPNTQDSISKLDPKAISNASPRHIQSVLEDLIVVCLQGQTLADKVLRLNPKSEEIGARTQPRPRAIGQRGWPQRCGRFVAFSFLFSEFHSPPFFLFLQRVESLEGLCFLSIIIKRFGVSLKRWFMRHSENH